MAHPDFSREAYFGFKNLRSTVSGIISGLSGVDISRLVDEVLLNSAGHGNSWDASKPLSVVIYSGANGWLLNVTDAGTGFNYFKSTGIKVSFSDSGKTISLSDN